MALKPEFSDEQLAVINSQEKRIAVLAGAGSGKTRTVVGRVARLLDDGVDPRGIVCISFTKKSGQELEHRLSKISKEVWCGTLHSLCLEICEGRTPGVRVVGEGEKASLIMAVSRQQGLVDLKTGKFHKKSLSWWCNEIDKYRMDEIVDDDVARVAKIYASKLRAGADYDYLTLLIEAKKYIKEGDASFITHLFVDEAQDIDMLQWGIIEDLIAHGSSLTCVGDVRQALYRFRNAVPEQLPKVSRNKLTLDDCYRCPAPVVRAANHLISLNPEGGQRMKAVKEGKDPTVTTRPVVNIVQEFIDNIYQLKEIAVLCRTNKQVDEYITQLKAKNIPVYIPSKPNDNDLVSSLMKFGIRPKSEVAWANLQKAIKYELGLAMDFQLAFATERMQSHKDPRIQIVGKSIQLAGLRNQVVGPVIEELDGIVPAEELKWWRDNHLGRNILKAVNDRALVDFTEQDQGNNVAVMTVHQAKGLEWDAVVIADVSKGVFPNNYCRKIEDIEDERRIMYVAMTRAKEHLVINHNGTPSQFIKEARLIVPDQPVKWIADSVPF